MVLKESPAAAVLDVVSVVCRVKRPGVGDQRPASSDFKISSIRCETSFLPLRPAAPTLTFPWLEMALPLDARPSFIDDSS